MHGSHGETIGHFLYRNRGCGLDALRLEPGLAQLRGERHRETSRVCRAHEFLRISSFFILETRAKRIRSVREYAAVGGTCAAGSHEGAMPDDGGCSRRG